ncbi:hypothetical protein MMC16_006732 [Acarospora aff. strigata]|nr:hypothetical protein [Acarospora aff. strigata]
MREETVFGDGQEINGERPTESPSSSLTPVINLGGKHPAGVSDDNPPSNGGLVAWSQVVGSFFLFFNSWGIVNAFGVYQTYYEMDLLSGESPSNISWIGSIQAFLLMIIGVMTGPIYDAGHFQALVRTGSFLVVFGIMMTSLCTRYWEVMLAQGICIGLGSGCLFVPSVAILPQYFTTKKAFANGIAASGSSLGGIIYPIVFQRLEPQIGFAWATRVLGFLALALSAISLSLMRIRVLPREKRAFLELAAFREPPYTLFTVSSFFAFIGLYTPIFYIETYAIQEKIMDPKLASYMLPILNAASIFGRVIPNFFADKTGPLNMLIPCALVTAVLSLCWIRIKTTPGLVVFAILYGFTSGTFVSLPPTALTTLSPHLGVVGTRMGMSFAVSALGLLIGTPVSGAILNSTGQFLGPQLLAGGTLLIGAAFLTASRICKVGPRPTMKA